MDSLLNRIVSLVKNALSSSPKDSYKLLLVPTEDEKGLLGFLEKNQCIQEINNNGNVISAQDIQDTESISVEIISFGLQKFGYYDNFADFINSNEFSAPTEFYIKDLSYFHDTIPENKSVNSYFAIINLISCLSSLSLFQSNEDGKTLYIMQEKSATALPIVYSRQLIEDSLTDVTEINSFVLEITGNIERKKIYIKELIDYLNEEDIENRFSHLYQKFNSFYHKCEAAYAFFLSDFSYSKLRLELESSILDYSKNIRSIINDSQTKLIAIPAAFIVASSQLNLENIISVKNFLIVVSSFVFSVLIEIFVKNQESSLKIFIDNIKNYKTTFKLRNENTAEKENKTLQSIISSGFQAIDDELVNQRKRLNWIRLINWGMSIFLIVIILLVFEMPFILNISRMIFNIYTSC